MRTEAEMISLIKDIAFKEKFEPHILRRQGMDKAFWQNFVYDFEQAENSLSFLQHVRKLPANAKEIYP